MDFQTILFDTRGQIAFVTFNRPESLNAVNRQMARELIEACAEIEKNSAIRIAIFTGAGEKAFSAGMDFYRDEKNKDRVIKYLGEYYRSNVIEELEETRRVYSQVTPGLPMVTAKAMENVIANDRNLAGMKLNVSELLDLSFLEQLARERKAKGR